MERRRRGAARPDPVVPAELVALPEVRIALASALAVREVILVGAAAAELLDARRLLAAVESTPTMHLERAFRGPFRGGRRDGGSDGPRRPEMMLIVAASFTWQDGERTIWFGRGALEKALPSLGRGYALLTTPRARLVAPALAERAAVVHEVPPGRVDVLAGELLDAAGGELLDGELLVALGGGRVIDTAKALAAAREPRARPRIAAVPTTLSAAEMTAIHRRAAGADASLPGARPAFVVNDPALSASQPPQAIAASAANALAHAAEGPATLRATPVPALAGREAARLVGEAYADPGEPDRDALALGALLSGYAIDQCGYGLHHVLAQTLVRLAGIGHGPANAVMLPHTLVALERRGAASAGGLVGLATELAGLAQAVRLRDLGVTEELLDRCADAAAARAELDLIPPRADRAELRALYGAAF
jgi:alcohol dehydrogenase class IV